MQQLTWLSLEIFTEWLIKRHTGEHERYKSDDSMAPSKPFPFSTTFFTSEKVISKDQHHSKMKKVTSLILRTEELYLNKALIGWMIARKIERLPSRLCHFPALIPWITCNLWKMYNNKIPQTVSMDHPKLVGQWW